MLGEDFNKFIYWYESFVAIRKTEIQKFWQIHVLNKSSLFEKRVINDGDDVIDDVILTLHKWRYIDFTLIE